MLTRSSPRRLAALAAIVPVLAACGSIGGSSSSGPVQKRSPIGSSASRRSLTAFTATARVPAKDRTELVDCLVGALRHHGVRTHGQFEQPKNQSLAQRLTAGCTARSLGDDAAKGTTGKLKGKVLGNGY